MEFNKELTYKELCQEFGESPVNGGTNRDRQLSRIRKKYEVEKIGRGKYIVKKEKSKQEIQFESDRKNYNNYLQAILLNMISKSPEVEVVLTYREIRENLMMVNSKYFPVKYNKEQINYNVPKKDKLRVKGVEEEWISISDKHDEDTIKYALDTLCYVKRLLVSVENTYLFYRFEKDEKGNVIFCKPVQATNEQLAEIRQRQLEFIKSVIDKNTFDKTVNYVDEINRIIEEKNNEADYDKRLTKKKDILGACVKQMYGISPDCIKKYNEIINNYIQELGYNRYARAFKIVRPSRLEEIIGYYAPKFNELQVSRYLTSPRFKWIPVHFQKTLVEELIKTSK